MSHGLSTTRQNQNFFSYELQCHWARARSKFDDRRAIRTLVGASALDVTRLLAAVAHTLVGGLGRAVARQVANLTTVVALLTLGAVTAHVSETTAGVAGRLPGTATVTTLTAAVATAAVASTSVAAATLAAVSGDVAGLAALVAFLTTTGTATDGRASVLGALTADVANSATAVA